MTASVFWLGPERVGGARQPGGVGAMEPQLFRPVPWLAIAEVRRRVCRRSDETLEEATSSTSTAAVTRTEASSSSLRTSTARLTVPPPTHSMRRSMPLVVMHHQRRRKPTYVACGHAGRVKVRRKNNVLAFPPGNLKGGPVTAIGENGDAGDLTIETGMVVLS